MESIDSLRHLFGGSFEDEDSLEKYYCWIDSFVDYKKETKRCIEVENYWPCAEDELFYSERECIYFLAEFQRNGDADDDDETENTDGQEQDNSYEN